MGRTRRTGSRVRRTTALLAAVTVGLALHAVPVGAQGEAAAAPADGRALYLQSCAPCHGATGKGDGPEASSFAPPPPDLRAGTFASLDEQQMVAKLRDGLPLTLGSDPRALQERLGHLEEITGHLQKLPSIDWPAVDRGAALYEKDCAACHGPFGQALDAAALPKGVQKPPRDLRDPVFQKATSDEQLIADMQHGKSAMPAIPATREQRQARDLVVFIRLLSPGFETYSYYCAPCHGDDGRGHGVFATGKNAPPVAFDRTWVAKQDPEQLRIHVTHMLSLHGPTMPHFRGTLDDAQLRAIARYIKSAS